jgi:hypothetical protein
MSIRDIPNEYNNYFALPYKSNSDIDQELINATDEIMRIKTNNVSEFGRPSVKYNPLYSPNDLIDYGIERNYKISTDKNNSNSNTNSKFDPYLNYLKETGLANDSSKVRYNVEYVNIDSSNRKKVPYNIIEKTIDLEENPLSYSGNYLEISVKDDSFYIGQKISINGLYGLEKSYKKTTSNTIINFIANSEFVEINVNANLVYESSLYSKIDTEKMFVSIDNIPGNNLSSYIGNIPINLLNKTHQIYLIKDSLTPANTSKFYIKLPVISDGTQCDGNFYFNLTFQHYNCIPINEINADYPVNNDHINGYQVIQQINNDKILVKIYPPTSESTSQIYNNFGGKNIYISTIKSINKAYPYSHSYTIELPKTYSNIIQVKVLASLFPDVFKSFRDGTISTTQNNKLYFQDIDNGNNISIIELEAGTYTEEEFITKMEQKFYDLERITDFKDSPYDNRFHVKINIEKSRDYIEFNNYRKAFLKKSIVAVTPPINQSSTDIGVGSYVLTILHPNHGIRTTGTKIIFNDFVEHLGIDAKYLNTTHTIINIVDVNRYDIQLNNVNLNTTKNITGGGFSGYVLVPSLFRFLFNHDDSMGEQFGFRNIGDSNSITKYTSKITNKDLYENETIYDSLRNIKPYLNTSLTFNRNQYIIMTCKQLSVIKNTIQPYDIFAKINLTSTNTGIMIDELISPPIFYYNPILRLNELTFEFFDPNGEIYDFNNVDHSFILEFTMIDNIPENTGLNSNSSNIVN